MKRVLFVGSFDPVTLGHLDIIERSAALFETLIVGIAFNLEKSARSRLLSVEDTKEALKQCLSNSQNIEITNFSGLTVEFAAKHQIDILVRSLRSMGDFEWEMSLACANRRLSGLETLFISGDPQYNHISSTLIREIAAMGGNLEGFVPPIVAKMIYAKQNV